MKKIKSLFGLLLTACCISCTNHPVVETAKPALQQFTLNEVKLLPGAFYNARQTDIEYMLALEPDRLLAPYLREAGLPIEKESYGNWENTGLDGHIGGHYLTALAQMVAATGHPELNKRLDDMLETLKKCQDNNGTGYLGGTPGGMAMWHDIAAGKIETDNFHLNGQWVPLYNIHKLLAGLRDGWLIAKKPLAKEILIKLTDFIEKISRQLTDQQIQTMLVSEHGGLNEIFADVSVITGDPKYLTLAKRFSHQRILNQLANHQDSLTGLHANMQIPKIVGFQRIAEVTGDSLYARAAKFFWETVVHNRTIVIGGNSVQEHFNPTDDFSDMIANIAGPETCNSYNMLKLSRLLFETEGDSRYIDYYESTLYNHILSSQHPEHGGFVYYTPMRPRHYRVYSQPTQCMWCCVGSGMENHGKYGELIYSHRDNNLYINLFIPSQLNWAEKGWALTQQTNFPDEASTRLTIDEAGPTPLAISVRYPGWVAPGQLQISINNEPIEVKGQPGSYVTLERQWKKGDQVELLLPMQLSAKSLPSDSGYIAFLHGPIVLAAKTDSADHENFLGDSVQFEGYRARGKQYPLDDAPLLADNGAQPQQLLQPVAGKPQTFVAPGLFGPDIYQNLELIPFYKLHDSRYVIYFRRAQPPKQK